MRQLVLAALAAVAMAGLARADEEKVPLDKLPKGVLEAAKKRFPKAEVVGASKEKSDDGKDVYEVELKQDGKTIDVTLTPDAAIILIEQEITAAQLPKAVADAVEKKYPKATYTIVESVTAVKNGKETLEYYEALLTTADKKEVEVQVLPDGTIKNTEDKSAPKKDDKKPEKGEKKPEKGEEGKLPKAVAAAVQKIFPGMKVVEVDEEDEDGEKVYEVTLKAKGATLEVIFSPKGVVLKVEVVEVKEGTEKDKQEEKKAEKKEKKEEKDD
ncbi:MAG: PepSY-like domain-containing protein [Gemmataceae bacterium]|nr:PepSY-like domain-containing protein [Gemmataceae bacterium]